jgi:transcriptional regulator with XRE-family HTH domain
MTAHTGRSRPCSNVRALRERAGLSQDELAARVAISQPKLSRVERGFLSLTDDERLAIATELGVEPDALSAPAPDAEASSRS